MEVEFKEKDEEIDLRNIKIIDFEECVNLFYDCEKLIKKFWGDVSDFEI